jgi:RES domain-containing protein
MYDPGVLDTIDGLPVLTWSGVVFRHMLGDFPPQRANTSGARWNPPDVAAIYTSLSRETAIAEGSYRLSLESVPIRKLERKIYRVTVSLAKVVDLRAADTLAILGVEESALASLDWRVTQRVGGAAAYLSLGGILVPSARHAGANLVIFPTAAELAFESGPPEVL